MDATNYRIAVWKSVGALCVAVTVAGCRGSGDGTERAGSSSSGGGYRQTATSWPKGTEVLGADLDLVEAVASGDQFMAADSSGVIWSVSRAGGSPARIGSVGAGVVRQMVVAGDQVVLLLYEEQEPRGSRWADFTKPVRLVRVSTKDGSSAVIQRIGDAGGLVFLATDGRALYVARATSANPQDVPYVIDVRETAHDHPTSTITAGAHAFGFAADLGRDYWPTRRVFWASRAGVEVAEFGVDGRWGEARVLAKDFRTMQVAQGHDGLYGFIDVDLPVEEASSSQPALREMGVEPFPTRRMLSPGTLERIDRGGEHHSIGGEVVEAPHDVVVGKSGVCFSDGFRGTAKLLSLISLPDGRSQSVAYAPGVRCLAIEPDFVYAFAVPGRGIARIPRTQ